MTLKQIVLKGQDGSSLALRENLLLFCSFHLRYRSIQSETASALLLQKTRGGDLISKLKTKRGTYLQF